MNNNINDINILNHIIEYCVDIEQARLLFGNDINKFKEERLFRHLCCHCLSQIGELIKHLSSDFINKNDEINWNKLRFVRNIIAHDYMNIDYEATWFTLNKKIPQLKLYCENYIKGCLYCIYNSLPLFRSRSRL